MNKNLSLLEKYNHPKNIRYNSFFKSLSIADSRHLRIFVETGTSRGKTKFFFINRLNWKDGMSTLIFAEYAKYINGTLYTCDISPKNINNSMKFTEKFKDNIKYITSDSVQFLKDFKTQIDFLYLDSLDGHNSTEASLHQLKEIQSAMNKLHKNSLILLDDKLSKSNLSLNFMLKKNFKILNETNEQVLLSL